MNGDVLLNRKTYVAPLAALGFSLLCAPVNADKLDSWQERVDANLYIAQGFQHIDAQHGAFAPANQTMQSGFQRLRFNLDAHIQVTDAVAIYVDVGEEPNDFGSDDQFEISQDLAFIDVELLPKGSPSLTLRAGNIVSTVFDFRGYSDGAAVQTNPLIGNSPVDFVTAESGAQLRWAQAVPAWQAQWYADAGVTVPTFFEDYGDGRGYNYFGKLGLRTLASHWGVSLGWFFCHQGDQVGQRSFDQVQTAGLVQGDGDNYNFAASGSNARDTHVGLLPGLNTRLIQFNSYWQASASTLVRAWVGMGRDAFSFADTARRPTVASQASQFIRTDSELLFYALEVSHMLIADTLYIAGRYSAADNRSAWADSGQTGLYRA